MKRFAQYNRDLKEAASGYGGGGIMTSDVKDTQILAATDYFAGHSDSGFYAPRSKGVENPIDRYYDNNESQADEVSTNTISMMLTTPGQEGDGEGGEEGGNYHGMTTDALNMGPAGSEDDETLETIQKAAMEKLKHSKEKWEFLKTWIRSFGVDDKTQAKITGLGVIAGINAPSIAKLSTTYIPATKRTNFQSLAKKTATGKERG